MVHIAICDDESELVEYIKSLVLSYLNKLKIIGKVITYTNAETLVFDVQEGIYYELIILDIEMPKLDGMKAAAEIRKCDSNCLLIFLTSHLKYAIDAFRLSVFRYIPKSQIADQLEDNIKLAFEKISEEKGKYYILHTHKSLQKIYYQNILYIKKDGKNSVVYTLQKEAIKIRKSLSDLFSELNSEEFVFIDRGCIANIIHIMKIENEVVYFRNSERMYISKSSIKVVKSKTAIFWSDKL